MDNTEKIIDLLLKRYSTPLSEDENRELQDWIDENPEVREALVRRLSDPDILGDSWRKRSLINSDNRLEEMRRRLLLENPAAIRRRRILRIATLAAGTAAAIALIFKFASPEAGRDPNVATQMAASGVKSLSIDSIDPGETLAYVSLGGEKIMVENSGSPQGVPVESLRKDRARKGPVTLEVPRGGEFIVILEDSTKVWLNSSSTLTYPENFKDGERRVSISGEAYFAVTKDKKGKPFYVETSGQEIRVYGTEFNVRAYPEESAVYTSLSSGKIGLRKIGSGGELILTPGHQAVLDKSSMEATVRNVDIETVTGWTKGRFVFQEQSLGHIMADLGRWYDFDFEFEDPALEEIVFMGSIPRYSDFSTAMLILEKTGGITFSVKDNKVLVKNK